MKRFVATVATVLIGLALLATPVQARKSGPAHSSRYNSPARTYYYSNDATAAISWAAARWGVSYGWLLRVASCESGLNPSAYNGSGASGLFQFMPGTYWTYAAQIGETRSYWNAWGSANVAAYMFHIGQSYQWACR